MASTTLIQRPESLTETLGRTMQLYGDYPSIGGLVAAAAAARAYADHTVKFSCEVPTTLTSEAWEVVHNRVWRELSANARAAGLILADDMTETRETVEGASGDDVIRATYIAPARALDS